jgi:type III secretion protein U
MAGAGDAEDRPLPPSLTRLRDLRRDGQVPRSRDFPAAVALVAGLAWLALSLRGIGARMEAAFMAVVLVGRPFAETAAALALDLAVIAAGVILPVFAVMAVAHVAASVAETRGVVASFAAVSFDVNRLNPAEGLRRLFGLHGWVELGKSLVKALAVLGVLVLLLRGRLNDLLWAPACGVGCLPGVAVVTIGTALVAGSAVLLLLGLADLPLSRALFRRDHRMSLSEMKRETKQDQGDPAIRRERRDRHRAALDAPGLRGLDAAAVVLVSSTTAIAIAWRPGRTPAPVLVARADGAEAASLRIEALRRGIPVAQEAALADMLRRRATLGDYVPQDTFAEVARVLVAFDLVG